MPRARKVALPDSDDLIVDPASIDPDPQPKIGRPRKAPAKTARPGRGIPARSSSGRILSDAQLRGKVRDELTMWISIGAAAWEFRDPECAASVYQPTRDGGDRIAQLSDRMTSMLARNPKVLAYAARTGIFGDLAACATLLAPVGQAVWRAHGPNGHGHDRTDQGADLDAYPAYSGAPAR